MSDAEFIADRTEHLAELRSLLETALPELAENLPDDHTGELNPRLYSTACAVLDAVRCYSTAPHHFDGKEAAKAKLRQINERDQRMAQARRRANQTPDELRRMAEETKRVDHAEKIAIERNGDQPIYTWSMLNALEQEFDAPASLIYERLELRYGFGTFKVIENTNN